MDRIYRHLPIWAQHLAVSAYGWYWHRMRFGGVFESECQEYLERESFSREQWQKWQNEKVKQLLNLAVEHIPYYRDNWTKDQKVAAKEGRLEALPLLEKDPLRSDTQLFHRDDIHPSAKVYHTSGSTGTPIGFSYTNEEYQRSMALRETRACRWAGVSYRMPRSTFSGRIVEPNPDRLGPRYRYNMVEKQVYFSPFHLGPKTVNLYIDALKKHGTQWMTGYAVSHYLLAKFALEAGLEIPKMKAIITTSEKAEPEMKALMEEAFSCKVFEEYSTVENAIFVSECEHGRLHSSPDVAVVEILRPDGSACDPGEVGEIVLTRLCHEYQILVRYRVGDRGAWSGETCPCGREMPIIKEIAGRLEDVVTGPDGRQMVRFHGVWIDLPGVSEGQFIQEAIDHVTLRISVNEKYEEQIGKVMIDRVQERLGREVQVDIEIVDQIPREKSGKVKAVISKLKR